MEHNEQIIHQTQTKYIQDKIDLIELYPDSDRIQWLRSRPWFNTSHDQINSILEKIAPKTHLVAAPHEHVPVNTIISFGKIIELPAITYEMEHGHCHDNCEILYHNEIISNVYTGYALSSDGLWRFHSWGLDHENFILETTSDRLLYFGVPIYSKSGSKTKSKTK